MHPYRMQQLLGSAARTRWSTSASARSSTRRSTGSCATTCSSPGPPSARRRAPSAPSTRPPTPAGELAVTWTLDMLTAPRHEFAEFTAALAYLPLLDPEVAADALALRLSDRRSELERVRHDLEHGAGVPAAHRRSSRPSTRSRTSRPTSPGSPPSLDDLRVRRPRPGTCAALHRHRTPGGPRRGGPTMKVDHHRRRDRRHVPRARPAPRRHRRRRARARPDPDERPARLPGRHLAQRRAGPQGVPRPRAVRDVRRHHGRALRAPSTMLHRAVSGRWSR